MSRKAKGILLILLAACCWGVFPSITRYLYGLGMTSLQTVTLRALVAAVVYLILALLRGTFRGLTLRDLPFFFGYGMAAVLSTYVFYALAFRYLSGAMAAILLYTAPAFVILFSRLLYGDRITLRKGAAVLMALLGCALVVKVYDKSTLTLSALGILFGLLSGIGYSMLTVIGRVALQKYTSEQNTYLPTFFTALVMCVISPPWRVTASIPDGKTALLCLLCILGMGIIGSVIPYLCYLKGLDLGVDGGNASILANMEPLTATLCGALFFGEGLDWLQLVGILLVLVAATLPNLTFSKEETALI